MSKKSFGSMLGIEIGTDTLKIAVLSNGEVTQLVSKRLPKGAVLEGKIASVSDMAATIKACLKENNIRCSNCALVLPAQFVIGRSVTMPTMSEEEYMINLPFELKDFIGKDVDKYYYDYTVKSVEGKTAELYACAVLKSDIDVFYDVMRKAGLKMRCAVPPEISWLNLIRAAKNEPKNICIVDIGFAASSVNIYSNGSFVMGKSVELAGHTIDEALGKFLDLDSFAARTRKEANLNNCIASDCCTDIYSEIANEVTRIVKYYNDVHGDNQVQDIYYCGGSAIIEPLRMSIIRATGMTPHHISRLIPGIDDKDELTLCCALAVGAAVGI